MPDFGGRISVPPEINPFIRSQRISYSVFIFLVVDLILDVTDFILRSLCEPFFMYIPHPTILPPENPYHIWSSRSGRIITLKKCK